ncbi:hypothetical protein HW130_03285 [Streptomyces sp. PKU-EA00015]|uniref:hypothetical protein n=1 Tax=Streptomyces sp. PKU-EA00015 TaxID=2748326 RepID=UPI0015A0C483|nr:hypothetical protein [Streptomyces sp. PKU-EA00015]NWF25296.1 hypothetical protein [Streptomyces sp. PKU-EA00015]
MTAHVVSPLLSDVRPLVPRPRPPADPNYTATLAAGYVESLNAWTYRVIYPDWADRLAYAACWSIVVTAAWVQHLEARLAEVGGA